MTTGSVKMSLSVIKKVKANKKKTGVEIGKFFEIAALEKLEREKATSNGLPRLTWKHRVLGNPPF